MSHRERQAGRRRVSHALLDYPPIARVPLLAEFTPMEHLVSGLVGYGHNYHDVAERLGLAPDTIATHARTAARKIPGDLPQQMKIVAWFRGASIEVLTADWKSPYADSPPRV